MCISSPVRENVTVRRRRRLRQDTKTETCSSSSAILTLAEKDNSSSLSSTTTRSSCIHMNKTRRISDEQDFALCAIATKHLQNAIPETSPADTIQSSASEESASLTKELFYSPSDENEIVSNGDKKSWSRRLFDAFFAILGVLELLGVWTRFNPECGAEILMKYATLAYISPVFMTCLILDSLHEAKSSAFAYSQFREHANDPSAQFDRNMNKRSKPKWTSESMHLFASFLLFRIILLPIFIGSNQSTNTAAQSIVEIVLRQLQFAISIQVKEWLRFVKGRVKTEIVILAMTNPIHLKAQLYKLFRFIRWAKFLTPLIGTLNKFKGHCIDLHRKWAQRRRSRRARLLWDAAIAGVLEKRRFDATVLRLQRNFRSRRENKTERRMKLMKGRVSHRAKSVRIIQQRLEDEQTRVRDGIARIDEKIKEASFRRTVSMKDKEQMIAHKDGLRKNRAFLLRPNNNFAVRWKFVTVACVLLELSAIAFAPKLTGELKKMTIEQFAGSCVALLQGNDSTDMAIIWHFTANKLVAAVAFLVPIISGVDVVITFLTGELCRDTGTLVPKPWFVRWILPGVCLQLLVNPSLRCVSRFIRSVVSMTCSEVGLVSKMVCIHTALRPLIQFFLNLFAQCAHQVIEKENKKIWNSPLMAG